jgi:hypothetical protein
MQAKLEAKAKEEAEAARKAKAANIRGADSARAPTERAASLTQALNDNYEAMRRRRSN